jgi:integrase
VLPCGSLLNQVQHIGSKKASGFANNRTLNRLDLNVFPSVKLRGEKPLSASVMVQKYLRPAAISAGVIPADWKGRFGFHNFRHSLATALVKLKVDPKTVQGVLLTGTSARPWNSMRSPWSPCAMRRASSWNS